MLINSKASHIRAFKKMSLDFTRGSEVKLLTLQGFRRGVVTDKGYLRNRPGVLMYRVKFDEHEDILHVDAINKNLMSASVCSEQYLFDLFISEPQCPLGPEKCEAGSGCCFRVKPIQQHS